MAKPHELAEKDYILGMKYREIAVKYNVSEDTVKKWKTRYKWERDKPVKTTKKPVHNVHKNKKVDKGGQEPEEELSDMEQLFCYHYIRCWNATTAALRSGYSQNKVCAQVAGSRLLNRPRVKQEIQRLKELIKQEIHIDTIDLIDRCIKIAFADMTDYVEFGTELIPEINPVTFEQKIDEEGKPVFYKQNFLNFKGADEVDGGLICEIKQGKQGMALKLEDRQKALEILLKYFDSLPDHHKRRIEEAKLELERQKVKNGEKETPSNVNVIFNIPRPPRGEANV